MHGMVLRVSERDDLMDVLLGRGQVAFMAKAGVCWSDGVAAGVTVSRVQQVT